MKKIIFSLLVTVLVSNFLIGQNTKEYLDKPIFSYLKKTNNELYNELLNGKIEQTKVNEVNIISIKSKNGYLIDNSDEIIYTGIDKTNKLVTINRFNYNSKLIIPLYTNESNNFYIKDGSKVKLDNIFNQYSASENSVTFKARPCRDDIGFALCYGAVLISAVAMASSDGPLPFMDAAAISYTVTATAGCYRSFCN
jgi:hypothetical protein